jgi:hypothetical protein
MKSSVRQFREIPVAGLGALGHSNSLLGSALPPAHPAVWGAEMADEDLMDAVARRDNKIAYYELRRRNWDDTIAKCESEYSNCGPSFEIAGVAWNKVWNSRGGWVGGEFQFWFGTILRTTAFDCYRKRRRIDRIVDHVQALRQKLPGNAAFPEAAPPGPRQMDPRFRAHVATVCLVQWHKFDDRSRQIIYLRYWNGEATQRDLGIHEEFATLRYSSSMSGHRPSPELAEFICDCLLHGHESRRMDDVAGAIPCNIREVSEVCKKFRQTVKQALLGEETEGP